MASTIPEHHIIASSKLFDITAEITIRSENNRLILRDTLNNLQGVRRGAADIGIAGKDILLEYSPDVYELLDLHIGKCRMAVAAKKGFRDKADTTLRVATKFPNIAREYYEKKGRDIDIIKLNGSIELAPIVGLSEVIVDIVETGTTLKENGLSVLEEIYPLSARMVVNQVSMKMEHERIADIIEKLRNREDV